MQADTSEPYGEHPSHANSDNFIEQMGHVIWDTFKHIDQQWASILNQMFYNFLPVLRGNKAHNNSLPTLVEWTGWTM